MGGTAKWIKSLMGLKNNHRGGGENRRGRNWKLWRSSSGRRSGRWSAGSSETSSQVSAASKIVVRAPHRDFKAMREEWAAIRIQTAFRGFLSRRALRALKAVVRLQALVRGRRVRKQAAATLRCMQALVRVQEHVRGRRVRTSEKEEEEDRTMMRERSHQTAEFQEGGWCESRGSLEELRKKMEMKKEAATRRERALAYALDQKQWRPSSRGTPVARRPPLIDSDYCNGVCWSSLMGDNSPDTAAARHKKPPPFQDPLHGFEENEPVHVRISRNNITTRISSRPPQEFRPRYKENQPDPVRVSKNTTSRSRSESRVPTFCHGGGSPAKTPSYMSFTESTMAKQRAQIGGRAAVFSSNDAEVTPDRRSVGDSSTSSSLMASGLRHARNREIYY